VFRVCVALWFLVLASGCDPLVRVFVRLYFYGLGLLVVGLRSVF
jgi:hypothetical protein